MKTRLLLAQLFTRFKSISTRYFYVAVQMSIVDNARFKFHATVTALLSAAVTTGSIGIATFRGDLPSRGGWVVFSVLMIVVAYLVWVCYTDRKRYRESEKLFYKMLTDLRDESDAGAHAILYFFDTNMLTQKKQSSGIAPTVEIKR